MVSTTEQTVLSDSELIAGHQRFVADHTAETVEVIDGALGGPHDDILTTEAQAAVGTLGAKQPGGGETTDE